MLVAVLIAPKTRKKITVLDQPFSGTIKGVALEPPPYVDSLWRLLTYVRLSTISELEKPVRGPVDVRIACRAQPLEIFCMKRGRPDIGIYCGSMYIAKWYR